MRIGVVFLKNVLTLLASHALIPLQLMAAVSATVTTIQKTFFWSQMTTLIISNEWMKDIKILKSLDESDLLIKGVCESIENEANEQKGGFLDIFLGT